jgi:hypothetical protein
MTDKPIVTIKVLSQDYVYSNDKVLFNVNNLYSDRGDPQPDDYKEKGKLTSTNKWIDIFHKDNYQTLTLDKADINWMKQCLFKIGIIKRAFSHIYDDELEATCVKYEGQTPIPPADSPGWFIRSERVSLKEGQHGVGPYNSLKEIIESIVSAGMGHTCINVEDEECKLYFMKWQEIHPDKEFRIFVHNNEITAISTQHYPVFNHWLVSLNEQGRIPELVKKILDHFEAVIKPALSYLVDYTFDLAMIGADNQEVPYFIEPNGFGADYPAGSALFHWYYDIDTLHDSSSIEFRFVGED